MYCQMKATRRDAIANLKCFSGPGHEHTNFDSFIYIHYAAPPYSARTAPFTSLRLAKFGRLILIGFRLLTSAPVNEGERRN